MSAESPPARPRSREEVVFRPLGEEWVLYDSRSRELHLLNLTSALVWTHLDGEHTAEEVAELLDEVFGESPGRERVLSDVKETLERFAEAGLLAD